MMKYFLPLGAFAILVGFLAIGLTMDPREVPSPFIGKPAPEFSLPKLYSNESISPTEMQGKVWVLNVWASWCVSCRAEHAVITQLISKSKIDVIGLNYKDDGEDAKRWLSFYGNPYLSIAVDTEGRAGIDWGVYGVPETFIIDKKGLVRMKHIGPVTAKDMDEKLIPLIQKLRGEAV